MSAFHVRRDKATLFPVGASPRRARSCCRSSAIRDHSRSFTITGSSYRRAVAPGELVERSALRAACGGLLLLRRTGEVPGVGPSAAHGPWRGSLAWRQSVVLCFKSRDYDNVRQVRRVRDGRTPGTDRKGNKGGRATDSRKAACRKTKRSRPFRRRGNAFEGFRSHHERKPGIIQIQRRRGRYYSDDK
jgi:hypothetical protein